MIVFASACIISLYVWVGTYMSQFSLPYADVVVICWPTGV
jgi:hypothetical protein